MVVKVLTYNCQGLSSVEKRLDVFNYLKSKQCHIYCLQDIHSTTSNENYIRLQWGSDCIFSSGTSNSRGVAILFSKNVEYKVHNKITDNEGNYLILDLTIDNNKVTLVSLYGPNKDSPEFFEIIMKNVEKWKILI